MSVKNFYYLFILFHFIAIGSLFAEDDSYVLDKDTNITISKGFDAELLYTVPKSQGSWVAMAFDPKGRLIVSDQDDKGVFRVTFPKGWFSELKVESLKGFPYQPIPWGRRTVGGALGFLYAFDSLYMATMKGFYRCRDTNGDDKYDEFKLLKKLGVGYEHSAHSIILSEDKKALYLVVGNHTYVPKDVKSLLPKVWQEDSLLTAMPDAMGHAVGIKPPAGWIAKISPDGKDWTMIASGLRNAVDIAINREGELFTYDSDLEFDVGSPWYRPTRVNHVISASEFGWRAGSAKWPEYFADSVGSVINIGPGSPTGISFGHHSNFPSQFQDKLFICDWTFGTIYTVDMSEDGSSYTGKKKIFLHGTPLNISAMRFGPDGHMYFLIGGRNTDSKLYRIKYTGEVNKGKVKQLTKNQTLRDLRHSLEKFHGKDYGKNSKKVIDSAWPHLSHADRSIRYAARVAIESQDISTWHKSVFEEKHPRGIIHACIAFSRHAGKASPDSLLKKLNSIKFSTLSSSDQLDYLRATSLILIRMKKPSAQSIVSIIKQIDESYPHKDDRLNKELCRVLSYLEAKNVVNKTIELMKSTQTKTLAYDKEMLKRHKYGRAILDTMANTPNSQNIHYAYALRRVKTGWSLEDRKYYFSWLNDTLKKSGGKSFSGYIRAIRRDAIKHLPEKESASISWLLGDIQSIDLSSLPQAKGPGKVWTVENAMKLFSEKLSKRDFKNGKKMFAAGKCVACHRIQGSGGYSGPDLGSVGSRYSIKDILTAICEPSLSISEQYQASTVKLKNGDDSYGRVIYNNKKEVAVASNPFNFAEVTKIPAKDVKSIEPSNVSLMPPGTVFGMNAEELKDLMAYLISGGNKDHHFFK